MILEKFPEVQQLSPSEKLLFVSELWNDLEAHPSEVPDSREVIAELDRRMEHFKAHPDEFTTWEAVSRLSDDSADRRRRETASPINDLPLSATIRHRLPLSASSAELHLLI